MGSQETVDYKLLRQKRQEERFRARGATWKPSGKACTLQFVFDDEPRIPVQSNWTSQPTTTQLKPLKASQSKGRIEHTKKYKSVNLDVLDRALPQQNDEEHLELSAPPCPAARPREPRNTKSTPEVPQGHAPKKKPRVKDSHSAKHIPETHPILYENDTTASPLLGLIGAQASTSRPARGRKKKEAVKALSNLPLSISESPEPGEEAITVAPPVQRSVKPRRPKKVEKTAETEDRSETEKKPIPPKIKTKPVVNVEDSEDDIELSHKIHISNFETVAASVADPSNGRNAQPSKKRRILIDDGDKGWSMPPTQSTSRKPTIHFGLPFGGAR